VKDRMTLHSHKLKNFPEGLDKELALEILLEGDAVEKGAQKPIV
jgi:hypothetical protein